MGADNAQRPAAILQDTDPPRRCTGYLCTAVAEVQVVWKVPARRHPRWVLSDALCQPCAAAWQDHLGNTRGAITRELEL